MILIDLARLITEILIQEGNYGIMTNPLGIVFGMVEL